MKNNIQPIKYFAYVRKSSEGQERQALSIPEQEAELQKVFGKSNLDIEFIGEERSAFKPYNRPKFDEMLSRVRGGERCGVIAYSPDRLSRNEVDAAAITYMVRTGVITSLKFATSTFENTAEGIMMLQMALVNSQYDSARKSRDVKRGLEAKAKMGWRPSGFPIGYKSTPDKEKGFKEIMADPERFPLVRRMWDLMLTGNYSVPQVLAISKEWELKTRKHNKIGGKYLTKSYLYKNVFCNPFYYGWFQYKSRDTGEMVWQKGKHEPMITEEEYNHVQERLGRKDSPRPQKHHEMAFTSRLMKCASCGSSITAEPKIKRQKNGNVHQYVYYHCTKKKNPNCTERSVELKELNRQVHEILETVTISESFKNWAIKNLHEVRTIEVESHEQMLQNKHKELENVNKRLGSLLLRFTSPENTEEKLISHGEYQELRSTFLKRKNALESELQDKGKEMEQWLELSEKTFNFARYASVWFERGDNKTKRSILSALGSNLVLKDQKVAVTLHPFFSVIQENSESLVLEDAHARTFENGSPKTRKGTFVPSRPTGLPG